MGKAKGGRPRLTGKRYPCGRLRSIAVDRGNERVQMQRARFAVFQGGKAGNELGDPIGKAWAAGLLDGYEADSQAMRDIGRDFGHLHRSYYGETALRTFSPERSGRTWSAGRSTAADRRFDRLSAIVEAMSTTTRRAFYALCVETQDPDSVPAFVGRLINEKLHAGAAGRDDREKMIRACGALVDLVRAVGTEGRKAA